MKLLLIEDDPEMTDALRVALSQHGIVLDAVGDLATAREAIAMADYDIVLIDRQLPDGDGSTFLADLRGAGSNTRSIIISALRSTDERISGLNDGADDYLPKPFEIPELVLGQLGRFFALVPGSLHQPLQDFAASVVKSFEPFRAALSEADIARRKPEKLTESQRANLMRWGYPYVMDDFGFHMTLTGQVPEERSALMKSILEKRFAGFTGRPLPISGIAVFTEETRGADFKVHSFLPLTGTKR